MSGIEDLKNEVNLLVLGSTQSSSLPGIALLRSSFGQFSNTCGIPFFSDKASGATPWCWLEVSGKSLSGITRNDQQLDTSCKCQVRTVFPLFCALGLVLCYVSLLNVTLRYVVIFCYTTLRYVMLRCFHFPSLIINHAFVTLFFLRFLPCFCFVRTELLARKLRSWLLSGRIIQWSAIREWCNAR